MGRQRSAGFGQGREVNGGAEGSRELGRVNGVGFFFKNNFCCWNRGTKAKKGCKNEFFLFWVLKRGLK